jgi:outer membrane protein OmpA-like peptidoglycan-associated protein
MGRKKLMPLLSIPSSDGKYPSVMKWTYAWIFLLSLLLDSSGHAQNLVANGGFEDENICTEYNKNCAPEAWIATSLRANYYFDAPGYAHEGTHFTGLIVGNRTIPGIRSFIRAQLLCGLRKDHWYRLNFFVRSMHPVLDSIGIYFSSNDFLFEKKYFKDIKPQLWSKNGLDTPYRPSHYWQKVHFDYLATGEESYITIGSFKHNDYKNLDAPDFENNFYFFLDDVSFIPLDPREKLCNEADSIRLAIYDENERHDILERKIYLYRKNPPPGPVLPPTISIRIDTLIIPDIFFATASFQINKENYPALDDFCSKMATRAIDSLVIEGHTDSVGHLNYNQKLSENRARSVAQYVEQKSALTNDKIMIRYFASLRPAATNTTSGGRQKNRRVELYLYSHE